MIFFKVKQNIKNWELRYHPVDFQNLENIPILGYNSSIIDKKNILDSIFLQNKRTGKLNNVFISMDRKLGS